MGVVSVVMSMRRLLSPCDGFCLFLLATVSINWMILGAVLEWISTCHVCKTSITKTIGALQFMDTVA